MTFTTLHGFAVELVVHALAFVVCGWVLYQSWQFSNKVSTKNPRKSSVSSSRRVSSPRRNSIVGFAKRNRFVINLTLFENALYLLLVLVSAITVMIYLSRVIRGSDIGPFEAPKGSMIVVWVSFTFFLQGLAWVLITMIGFERLRVIFQNTRFEVSAQTTSTFHTLMWVFLMTNWIPVLTYVVLYDTVEMMLVYASCECINILLCVSMNSWVIRQFIVNSLAIVKGVKENKIKMNSMNDSRNDSTDLNHSRNKSEEPDSLPSLPNRSDSMTPLDGWSERLTHTALRVTISCSVPLISSVTALFLGVIAISLRSTLLSFFLRWLYVFDWCLNTFGILCTYSASKPYYDFVFGPLHRFIYRTTFVD